jgi:nitroimidazol reductase NimA-like FMN-containing flavoprotein (pyridoxamine 5'-phosphate oxidase superfamily)
MTTDHSSRSHVTRQDRAIQAETWIKHFLTLAPMGTLATAEGQQPYQSTLLFGYDEHKHAIYLHTARRGRVWENLRTNPQVCFTAAQMGRLLPAETALNFSVEYRSVVVFGSAVLVESAEEAEFALQLLLDKYFPQYHPGDDYRPITPEERNATAVYRLDIEEWSGKQKSAPDDFPGAFVYSFE